MRKSIYSCIAALAVVGGANADVKVGNLVKDAGAEVLSFVRFEVGEGIEKKEEDFAAEVAAQLRPKG